MQVHIAEVMSYSRKHRADEWRGVGGGIAPVSSAGVGHGYDGATVWCDVRLAAPSSGILFPKSVDQPIGADRLTRPTPSSATEAKNGADTQRLKNRVMNHPALLQQHLLFTTKRLFARRPDEHDIAGRHLAEVQTQSLEYVPHAWLHPVRPRRFSLPGIVEIRGPGRCTPLPLLQAACDRLTRLRNRRPTGIQSQDVQVTVTLESARTRIEERAGSLERRWG